MYPRPSVSTLPFAINSGLPGIALDVVHPAFSGSISSALDKMLISSPTGC